MTIAYIFPGQGSQYAGMGKNLAEQLPAARQVFEEADAALGFALSELCFNGPAEQLQLTENTQPAILTTSIAVLRAMEAEGFGRPDFVAGHSLGEYTALVAAGSLSISDALQTVRARGRYMQEAVPVGAGAMAAILGADLSTVMQACAEASDGQVCSPANINSQNQVVIAGDAAAIDRVVALLKERGAKRAIKLNVSARFFFSSRRRHTRLQGDWSSDVCSSDLGARRHADRVLRRAARGVQAGGRSAAQPARGRRGQRGLRAAPAGRVRAARAGGGSGDRKSVV